MFDVGFWELLIIAVVALLVLGPERLPEVAKQAAFFVRKARQGMYRLRNEMKSEMNGTPFADLQKAKDEIADLKNDMKQFGNELADSVEQKNNSNVDDSHDDDVKSESTAMDERSEQGIVDHQDEDVSANSPDRPSKKAGV